MPNLHHAIYEQHLIMQWPCVKACRCFVHGQAVQQFFLCTQVVFVYFMSPLYVQCQRRREKMLGSEYCWKFGDSKCRVPGDHGSIGEGRYLPAVEVTVNFDQ